MFKELVKKARSFRRFDNNHQIADEVLIDIIDTARMTPSGANRQPIKYLYSNTNEINEAIFPHLSWAGYLKDWNGPEKDEQPSAYIILYTETQFLPHINFDGGIIAQTIQLSATEKGLGSCMIASFDKNKLKRLIKLEVEFEIILVIAIGKPVEKVILEEVGEDGSIKYWRDQHNEHHVPKRKLQDIMNKVDKI